jgi:hypothetical protein
VPEAAGYQDGWLPSLLQIQISSNPERTAPNTILLPSGEYRALPWLS